MEQSSLFRKESMERIQSPEQLNDYMRVTNPAMWTVLIAVILLLAGMLIWSATAQIDSYASGTAQVQDGTMVVVFDDARQAGNVEAGMTVTVGDTSSVISGVGTAEDGAVFAVADTALTDGSYSARVTFRQTQVLQLLFN
ncbi:MAG: hypothetical protein IJH47_03520 [Oscillospiraceae bacterium]|nr:hypothetical protein [Oscillospiraceae bacterium]